MIKSFKEFKQSQKIQTHPYHQSFERGEKKRMLFALNEECSPIHQRVTSLFGLQSLGCLHKTIAVSPQLINPTKGRQRCDHPLCPHSPSPIRKSPSAIETCYLIMHGFSKLKSFVKGFLTSQRLVPLNFQPLPIISPSLSCSMFFNLRPCAIGMLFF
jgi:hypothetical protein